MRTRSSLRTHLERFAPRVASTRIRSLSQRLLPGAFSQKPPCHPLHGLQASGAPFLRLRALRFEAVRAPVLQELARNELHGVGCIAKTMHDFLPVLSLSANHLGGGSWGCCLWVWRDRVLLRAQ
jgi:hypothetical protein